MDEKKIIEKRSSFRGWKERNEGKLRLKKYVIGIATIFIILSILVAYPYLNQKYLNQKDNILKNKNSSSNHNSSNSSNSSITPKETTPKPTPTATIEVTPKITANEIIIGEIGVPLEIDGFKITVKTVSPSISYTSIWLVVKNIDDKEKSFKIEAGTVVTDNMGEQYENIHVKRSAEIVQTNLTAKAMREGAIFFERLKEGRHEKKLFLNINGQKAEVNLKK